MGRPSDLHATTPPKLARVIASRGGRTATALQTQSERGQGLSYKLFVRPSHRMASPSLQLLFLTSLLASLALTSNATTLASHSPLRASLPGTTEHLQQIFTGRCYAGGGMLCDELWEEFSHAFQYQQDFAVTPENFKSFLNRSDVSASLKAPTSKGLFWSGVSELFDMSTLLGGEGWFVMEISGVAGWLQGTDFCLTNCRQRDELLGMHLRRRESTGQHVARYMGLLLGRSFTDLCHPSAGRHQHRAHRQARTPGISSRQFLRIYRTRRTSCGPDRWDHNIGASASDRPTVVRAVWSRLVTITG